MRPLDSSPRTLERSTSRIFGVVAALAVIANGIACGGKVDELPVSVDGGDSGIIPLEDGFIPPPPPPDGDVPDPPPPPPPPPTPTNKVDLLFVIDNSLSMADKQAELSRRIPELIRSLTVPEVDPTTGKPRTKPIQDVHVAVISSSLGSHGTSACDPGVTNKHNDDRGHLLPRASEGGGTGWKLGPGETTPTAATCPAPVAASALSWAFDPAADPSARFTGTVGASDLQTATSCVVQSVKDDGCGYEETLESMYHFLIDPAPYASAKVKCTFGVSGDACGNNKIVVDGVDDQILAQRKSFLRPDSLVAIVILTDENDFSLKPASLNWLPWGYGAGQMQRGWTSCSGVPDDFEPETGSEYARLHDDYKCFSCFENNVDPNCAVPWAKSKLNADVDGRNTRGFNMVQRYGYNFLWSRQRYVDALTKPTVTGPTGLAVPNPLFAGGVRSPGMVFVATIVGVPNHLVADASGKPKSLTATDWEKIAGNPKVRDPHMIQSIAPRLGIPKYAGDPSIDGVNGGDRDVTDGDDLQYACIGPRVTTTGTGYECEGPSPELKNPLCGKGGTQPRFKAYPGLRHLRVVQALGPNGIVGSICAGSYAPVMQALVEKMQPLLIGK